ncbi:TPA: hypothetical protein QDB01_000339 [Burkholderia vietnamiensis]|nr:hypothetical protein [Burkholderia vietnamiensis]
MKPYTRVSLFPHRFAPVSQSKARRAGMKDPTRSNITPATPLGIDFKSKQPSGIVASGITKPWPGNLNMIPNSVIRSSLFGCARITGKRRDLFHDRVLATSKQYNVRYHGYEHDQRDCEVWELAFATARQSGKPMGAVVHFSFNDWCRILGRPINDYRTNHEIVESLFRLKTGVFIVKYPDGIECWYQPIGNVERDTITGRATLIIDPRTLDWLTHDTTEIDLKRKASLTSSLAKWMHDFFSTSSTPRPMKLSTLQVRSGSSLTIQPSNFRNAVLDAVEGLKRCDPPLFAEETRVEEAKKKPGQRSKEHYLVVVKATNSRIRPPVKKTKAPAATAASSQPVASVALPSPAAEPRPAAPKRAPKGAMSEDEADARAAYRKMLAERDRAEAALYVPKDGGRPLY